MCSIGRRDEIQLVISNKRDISLSRRYREGIGGDKTKDQKSFFSTIVNHTFARQRTSSL